VYAYSLSFFIFDEAGNAVAMLQNYATFHLNAEDEIVGSGEAYICDTSGDNCANINSPMALTVAGTRVPPSYSESFLAAKIARITGLSGSFQYSTQEESEMSEKG
jgi:hypothetical protein